MSSSSSSFRAWVLRGGARLRVLEELGLGSLRIAGRMSSGGQQQRVAVARAVASRPAWSGRRADGDLDTANAEVLMGLMRRLHDEHGMTFVFSTHDPRVVAHATRVVTLQDGCVAADEER